jgi:acyl-CoA synthetase (NDP forming)
VDTNVLPAPHALDPVLRPTSVAVIGASRHPTKRGYQVVKALQGAGFSGGIYPVNPSGGEVLGLPVARSVVEIEGQPELAVVATRAESVPGVLEECAAAGIRGAVVLAAGFREVGRHGEALERRLRDVARRTGIRVIGPNTSGVLNLPFGLDLLGLDGLRPGRVALLSQSGNVALGLLNELRAHPSAGVSVYVGVGNEADVGFRDVLSFLATDPNTDVVAMYVEGFRDGRAFMEAARQVTRHKPIVLLKGGRSSAGVAAVRSHTGAVAGEARVFRAAMAHAGVVLVERSDELLPVALTLAGQPAAPTEGGVAILSDGGGHAALAVDALSQMNIPLARVGRATRDRLASLLGRPASRGNPTDLAGAADGDPGVFRIVLETLLADRGVSGILVAGLFGGYANRFSADLEETERQAAAAMGGLVEPAGKPLVLHSVYAERRSEALDTLRQAGVPVTSSLEVATRCIAATVERGRHLGRRPVRLVRRAQPRPEAFRAAQSSGRALLLEPEARRLVESYGVGVARGRFCASAGEAATAADEIGYPVVLKVVSASIIHKTEAGGVLVGVEDAAAVRSGFEQLQARARRYTGLEGSAAMDGVLVSEMLPTPTAELLVGARRDEQFGPIVSVGLGGIAVELIGEVAIRPLPVSRADVLDMLTQGKIGTALGGVRGRAAADRKAMADLVLSLADALLANPEIAALESNPVFACPDRAVAVDVRLLLAEPRAARGRGRAVPARRQAAGD